LNTYHLHIEGRVQGVGFRPFIYGLAKNLSLAGTVANTLQGVHIFVNADEEGIALLTKQIEQKAPAQSIITSFTCAEVEKRDFVGFQIVESATAGLTDLLITPDFAICQSCKDELRDPNNRRYNYSYITCTVCGPRFSIEQSLPYDRHRTSMATFRMCANCKAEYENPIDNRFYSQTNSCPDCKVSQWVTSNKGHRQRLSEASIFQYLAQRIDEGAVIAMKGIGGFMLMCDAGNTDIVHQLRKKKQRPAKPFALMYPDEVAVQADFSPSSAEWNELTSPASPIVLLKPRKGNKNEMIESIAPGLDRLGVMLPYAPVFVQILDQLKRPLLATSGNLKGSPIIHSNELAISLLSGFVDHFLLHNRKIQIPQDDSVVMFSQKKHQKITIRRSRGYAPALVQKAIDIQFAEKVLAMGALLKSTFAIWQNGRCHISQFLGDTTELEAQLSFEKTVRHFQQLLQFTPDVILLDKHPAYYSTLLGKEMAQKLDVPTYAVQHHEAHLWAVLGENDLLQAKRKVLGVVLDGTGMGNDGAIWGGEFFLFNEGTMKRQYHLGYIPHILGDKMAREPRLSALAVLHAATCQHYLDEQLFEAEELDFYSKVLDHSSLKTSSIGRVFDAVASILGLCHFNTYEGEAAMYLERHAQTFCEKQKSFPAPFDFEILEDGAINLLPAINAIIEGQQKGKDVGLIAARFHSTVAALIGAVARREDVDEIAFGGGVMQNGLLVDMIIEGLDGKYKLHFHRQLSPNDECISYGQLVAYYASRKPQLKENSFEIRN
jgi:hydrogenase maturation protein HypF